MAPAAFHRVAFGGQNSERFHRIGSGFIIASILPLGFGLTSDIYVAVCRALDSSRLGAVAGGAIALILLWLWVLQPLWLRAVAART
jgi:hypothetical protein